MPHHLQQIIHLHQCFSTAGPRPGTGPWYQLYRTARICHFSFLRIFHEKIFYSWNILRRIIFVNASKISGPEGLNNICFIRQWPSRVFLNMEVFMGDRKFSDIQIFQPQFMTGHKNCLQTYYLLGPGPRLIKQKFTGPRSHKSCETLI
jgi:hypothetical protein